ncbi:hypothetical protein DPMN_132692 [Dreissena polymorpha]|uniref:DEAD/DEAH box helicase domain-containing protein n=1 Tax=Dreissena polymorpha TaxID=45954 RepID=A0A9D4FYT6_DREPO|nr:hypothetical protein DPMN_132692 [Dreissena polymorpha]
MDKLNAIVLSYDEKLVLLKEVVIRSFVVLLNTKGDLIVNLPVGHRKSILFHSISKLISENVFKPVVIVVSPLNIIQDQLVSLQSHSISSCRLDINSNIDEDGAYDSGEENDRCKHTSNARIEQLKRGAISVVLCHPEALLNTKKAGKS